MKNTKTTGEQTRHDFKTKGWSMNGTRCHILKVAKEFKGDNGEVVLMASPKRAFAGYALVFNGQLPMGCVWSTTRVGVKCVALASWNEIKDMELRA